MNPLLMQWIFDPMVGTLNTVTNPFWKPNNAAGCSINGIAVRGGVQQFLVPGGVGGQAEAVYDNSPGQLIDTFANTKWYVAGRCRLNAADADTYAYIGLLSGAFNTTIRVGLNGGASATNWSLAYGAVHAETASVLLGAIDANFHDFEMWCDGTGNVFASVDEGAAVSIAVGAITGGRLFLHVFNTLLAAAQREWDVDDACAVFESAA